MTIVTKAERIGDWIQTYTGKKFYPLDPRPEEICIEDIAHSLSLQCRFAGHSVFHYSTAQHSILVSSVLDRRHRAHGLLHDATEAYLVDLPRPIKKYSEIGRLYSEAEGLLWLSIADRFSISREIPKEVHQADMRMCLTEKKWVMPLNGPEWEKDKLFEPYDFEINEWPIGDSEDEFLRAFRGLRL